MGEYERYIRDVLSNKKELDPSRLQDMQLQLEELERGDRPLDDAKDDVLRAELIRHLRGRLNPAIRDLIQSGRLPAAMAEALGRRLGFEADR